MPSRTVCLSLLAIQLTMLTASGSLASQSSTGSTTWVVNDGGDLQAALDGAQPGDSILLQAGATFIGNFVLPAQDPASADYITIRSAAPDSSLPAANTVIAPTDAPQLPKIQSPNGAPSMATAPGAHHYKLQFLEFLANDQGLQDILDLGDGSSAQNDPSLVPHDLVVDRVYMHGDPQWGQKRAIALNSAATTIVNSYISEIKAVGQDSQAIAGWNGPGPFTIANNYLEAAGENIMFGGADPSIPNLVPSNITISGNHLSKQPAWQSQNWTVKNLLELKNAQQVVIDGNVIEYNWLAAQDGYAVLFTPRNQDGTAPWSVVQQVQFTNNVVRHVSSAINILGTDDIYPSQETNGILIQNNLFEDISSATFGGSGRFMQIGGGANVAVDHNTVMNDGSSTVVAYGTPVTGFSFTNNIIPDNSWAIIGDNSSPGNGTIATYFPGGQFLNGIFAGSDPAIYPAGNYFPPSMSAVGFVDLTAGNYRLSATSLYQSAASDGTSVGANIDAINAAAGTGY